MAFISWRSTQEEKMIDLVGIRWEEVIQDRFQPALVDQRDE
jgi:hypothetical protein